MNQRWRARQQQADVDWPVDPISVPPRITRIGLPAELTRNRLHWSELWLCIGLVWSLVGMAIMPSGPALNPSRLFQDSLCVLLFLPALILAVRARVQLWRELAWQPIAWLMLLLVLWANVTLLWSTVDNVRGQIWRTLMVVLFVLAWQLATGHRPWLAQALLRWSAVAIGIAAWAFSIDFVLTANLPTERIAAVGVIGTPNYAAAMMGAVTLCLVLLPAPRRGEQIAMWLAAAGCLLFIALTQSRSIWLAIAVCALAAPLLRPGMVSKTLAFGTSMAAVIAAALPLPILYERGSSRRVELFDGAMRIIHEHPWGGLGQGAKFTIPVAPDVYQHTHNIVTQTAVQLGVPGVVLFGAMWLLVAASGWRHRRKRLGRLLLFLWVFATVSLQFDMPQLLDSPRPGWILIWLPVALALGLETRNASRRGQATALPE